MERSDDRERRDVVSPTFRYLTKAQTGRVTPAEKRHLEEWIGAKQRRQPWSLKWKNLAGDIRALTTE